MEMEASDALLEVTRKGKAAGGELRFSLHSAHPQQHFSTHSLLLFTPISLPSLSSSLLAALQVRFCWLSACRGALALLTVQC